MTVTVITPSLPTRKYLLERAKLSVERQTVRAESHIIAVDTDPRVGPARLRNIMVSMATTEWVAFLDDDDELDPHHLETLLEASPGYDVIVPHCRVTGPPLPTTRGGYCNRPFDRRALKEHGIFPITVLARREAIEESGGFPDLPYEDWHLWNTMADRGYGFTVVPVVTWTYHRGAEDSKTTADHRALGR